MAGIGALTPHAVVKAAVEDAVTKGQQTAKNLQTLRSFYSDHVVTNATKAGATASPAYAKDGTGIPVPTTFILDVA